MLDNRGTLNGMDEQLHLESGYRCPVKQSSVRELESLVAGLHLLGDDIGAEHIEETIVSLLDRKICRKLISQGRQKR